MLNLLILYLISTAVVTESCKYFGIKNLNHMAIRVAAVLAASTGLAFGPAHVVKPREFSYERRGQSFKAENEKLEIALHQVKSLRQFIAHTESTAIKQIFMAHLEMLIYPRPPPKCTTRFKTGVVCCCSLA